MYYVPSYYLANALMPVKFSTSNFAFSMYREDTSEPHKAEA